MAENQMVQRENDGPRMEGGKLGPKVLGCVVDGHENRVVSSGQAERSEGGVLGSTIPPGGSDGVNAVAGAQGEGEG